MRREPGAGSREPVTHALQCYADRGVFRGFRATAGPSGRVEYQFMWLTRKPMSAAFDPRTRALTFPALFPGLDGASARDLQAIVASRRERDQPAHKRIDARRARISSSFRKRDLTLRVDIRGANHDYGVRRALNLINELFVMLQEHHQEYLIQQFGFSTE